jgi:hypothetical protein
VRRILIAMAATAAVAVGAWLAWRGTTGERGQYPIPGDGERITVEVLNATGVGGLARATTRQLRRAGIDVVYFGTASSDTLEQTYIAVRRGDTTAAVRIRAALGVGRIVVEPDSRLLLDASVFLGRDITLLIHFGP